MATVDEELLAQQQEDEQNRAALAEEQQRERQQDEQQRLQEENLLRQQQAQQQSPRNQAASALKKEGGRLLRKGIWEFLAATWEIWVPALLIILAIGLLVGVVVMIPTVACNSKYTDGLNIAALKVIVNSMPGDACNALSQTPPRSGGGGGGNGFSYGGGQSDAEIRAYLAGLGITVNKNCVDPSRLVPDPGQTCLTNMKPAAIDEIVSVAQSCDLAAAPTGPPGNRCGVMVTGGSELGHETGTCSHTSGDKFDLRPTAALDSYITNPSLFTPAGRRSDGATLYRRNSDSIVFADERNIPGVGAHWDVGCS